MNPSLADFRRTHELISPFIRRTPIVATETQNLFLKLENLQVTHSFKVRGAFAKLLNIVETGEGRTILTVSAGNHGQGIARAASAFKLPCVVVVPKSAPKTKVDAIRSYGVDLRIEGDSYDGAEAFTAELAKNREEFVFISPYNDPWVVLGQGTLGLEILEQHPDVKTILVPTGGGGITAGVAAVVKQLRPDVRVIGIQAEASAPIVHALRAGRVVTIPDLPSIADGIAGNIDPHTITFPLIQKYVDDVIVVSEDSIKSAILHLLHKEKLVAEGAAAVTIAAVMEGKVSLDAPCVGILTGGNLDLNVAPKAPPY